MPDDTPSDESPAPPSDDSEDAREVEVTWPAGERVYSAGRDQIFHEIMAGGVVAASVTAAASVAKAKIEATTQRLKNARDAETQRLKIEADERVAGIQAAAQVESARQQASPTAEVEGSTSG